MYSKRTQITKKEFILIANWKDTDFLQEQMNIRNVKETIIILHLIFYMYHTINIIYTSKYNRKRKNQVLLLMITDNEQQDTEEKRHFIALKSEITDNGYKKPIKSLSGLFRRVTSNHNGNFISLGCLHSFRTDNLLKRHERL